MRTGIAVKYANGYMKCYGFATSENYDKDNCISTALWTYPVAFVGSNADLYVSAQVLGVNSQAYITQFSRQSTSKALVQVKAMSKNDASKYTDSTGRMLSLTAFGKWK